MILWGGRCLMSEVPYDPQGDERRDEHLKAFYGPLPESQGQIMALTVSHVPRLPTLHCVIDSGLVGSTRDTTRAEDAPGTPTQSHISPSIPVYEANLQFCSPREQRLSKMCNKSRSFLEKATLTVGQIIRT